MTNTIRLLYPLRPSKISIICKENKETANEENLNVDVQNLYNLHVESNVARYGCKNGHKHNVIIELLKIDEEHDRRQKNQSSKLIFERLMYNVTNQRQRKR